jgi:hypothetical protein
VCVWKLQRCDFMGWVANELWANSLIVQYNELVVQLLVHLYLYYASICVHYFQVHYVVFEKYVVQEEIYGVLGKIGI